MKVSTAPSAEENESSLKKRTSSIALCWILGRKNRGQQNNFRSIQPPESFTTHAKHQMKRKITNKKKSNQIKFGSRCLFLQCDKILPTFNQRKRLKISTLHPKSVNYRMCSHYIRDSFSIQFCIIPTIQSIFLIKSQFRISRQKS